MAGPTLQQAEIPMMVSKRAVSITTLRLLGNSLLGSLCLSGLVIGCAVLPQIYSTSHSESISLQAGDLERAGLAILTPDTVWGRDEDKQALALIFTAVLKNERPAIGVIGLPQTLNRINRESLSAAYRQLRTDYRESGLFPPSPLQRLGQATGARYVAQLKLAGFDQNFDTRLSAFGLRLMATKYANMRLFLQIWDTETATIAWEGSEESNYAVDTGAEKAIPFKTIVEETARNLIATLPRNPPKT
jgi:hypothetical protein